MQRVVQILLRPKLICIQAPIPDQKKLMQEIWRIGLLLGVFGRKIALLYRKSGDQISHYGLTIVNSGIDEFRSPLFRVTYLVVIGPGGDEVHIISAVPLVMNLVCEQNEISKKNFSELFSDKISFGYSKIS